MVYDSCSQFILKPAPGPEGKIIFAPLAPFDVRTYIVFCTSIADINSRKSPQNKNYTKNSKNDNKQNVCMNLNKTQSMTINQVQRSMFTSFFFCLFMSTSFSYRSCLLLKATRNSFSTVSNQFRYLFFK